MGPDAEYSHGAVYRVLVIDDSPFFLTLLREQLRRSGFEVETASSVLQFDRLLESWQPNIVLADVHMPDISGVQLCTRLKEGLEEFVPVILFSARSDKELASLAESCGADGFISKNVGSKQLAAEVTELIESIIW